MGIAITRIKGRKLAEAVCLTIKEQVTKGMGVQRNLIG